MQTLKYTLLVGKPIIFYESIIIPYSQPIFFYFHFYYFKNEQ
jgi:hypothetical protein